MKHNIHHLLPALLLACLSLPAAAQSETGAATGGSQNGDSLSLSQMRDELNQMKSELQNERNQLAKNARDEKIWQSSSPFTFFYANQTLTDDATDTEIKSKFSFGISKRHTYYLHSKAIAGMLKFGLDANWFEISYTQYKKDERASGTDAMGNVVSGTFNTFKDYFDAADRTALEEGLNASSLLNMAQMGKHQIMISALGFGPSIKLVPFYPLNKKALDKLKISAYFHYVPTFTALLFSGNEVHAGGGYMSCWRAGGNLSFGRFGIGIEHQWGSGNIKMWSVDDEDNEDNEDDVSFSSEKTKYLLGSTRFYIGFKF